MIFIMVFHDFKPGFYIKYIDSWFNEFYPQVLEHKILTFSYNFFTLFQKYV
jgi:hypothetical protein